MNELKKEYLKEFGARVRMKRKEKGLTMEEFSIACGYTNRSAAYNIEVGRQEVTMSKLQKIAEVLEVSPIWLQTGKEADEKVYIEVSKEELTHSEKELLTAFRKMTVSEQELIVRLLNKES